MQLSFFQLPSDHRQQKNQIMNWNKPVKFKFGGEDWEMPLSTLLLLIGLTLLLMVGGAWLGYRFGAGQL
jgi:hypothetical protein